MKLSLRQPLRPIVLGIVIVVVAMVLLVDAAEVEQVPKGWSAENMKPIGYSELDGRGGAFKMAIKQVNNRWYLYMGHLWHRGWTIVDVTDSTNPKVVKFIPGPDNTWTIQMDLYDNIMITALQGFTEAWGADPNKPFEEGLLIWDISDPVNPKQLSHWKTGSRGTHRNLYPGGKYAYLAANMPGFRGQILVILDVSDRRNPKEAGRWWMPGQKENEPPPPQDISFHGSPIIDGKTAYLGYGNSIVILDIGDVSKPRLIGRLDMSPPFKPGGTAVHDVLHFPGKSLVLANSEAGGEMCAEPLNHASLIDIKDPTRPRLLSLLPVPVPPKGAPYSNFCDKGGRFGPHNTNSQIHLPEVEKPGDLIYLTYFNAGLRIFDIKDPRAPKEVGWFIPPTPTKRYGPIPTTKLVNQAEDVLVDTRGNIYITDKQWGLWVLRYSGKGQPTSTTSGANR